jgi:hypothetical protein
MIQKIVSLIVEESLNREGCQDEVSAIHSVMMDITLEMCDLFRQIREQEALNERTC